MLCTVVDPSGRDARVRPTVLKRGTRRHHLSLALGIVRRDTGQGNIEINARKICRRGLCCDRERLVGSIGVVWVNDDIGVVATFGQFYYFNGVIIL